MKPLPFLGILAAALLLAALIVTTDWETGGQFISQLLADMRADLVKPVSMFQALAIAGYVVLVTRLIGGKS